MSEPRVSIVIPVHNGSNYLREAIDSAVGQTYSNVEVIVVNDGSSDGGQTEAIVLSFGDRIRYFDKENGGVASALNLGIKNMCGDWFAWLSHDDVFLPTKLERQVEFLQQFPVFKACYTDFYDIDADGNIIREHNQPWYPRMQAARVLFHTTYLNGSSMLIERTCFDVVGLFNERLRNTQDVEMWLRMVQHFEVGHVPEKLLKRRVHPAMGSLNVRTQVAEEQATFRQIYNELGIAGVFPELAQSANDPQVVAWGHEWLGDTMLVHRRWYPFACDQYQQAVTIWPSWRNRARLKRVLVNALLVCRPWYRRFRGIFDADYRAAEA